MIEELLVTKEAARIVKLSPRTLENQRLRGGGPRYIKLGGAVRYRIQDLEEWIASHTKRNTAE